MPKTHPPYPAEFLQQIIELVRAGGTPAELSREPIHQPGLWQSLPQMGVRPSIGTVGGAYDNAMAESFFASLEDA